MVLISHRCSLSKQEGQLLVVVLQPPHIHLLLPYHEKYARRNIPHTVEATVSFAREPGEGVWTAGEVSDAAAACGLGIVSGGSWASWACIRARLAGGRDA